MHNDFDQLKGRKASQTCDCKTNHYNHGLRVSQHCVQLKQYCTILLIIKKQRIQRLFKQLFKQLFCCSYESSYLLKFELLTLSELNNSLSGSHTSKVGLISRLILQELIHHLADTDFSHI